VSTNSAIYPLTYGQRALWLVHKLLPGNTAYNFMVAAKLLGGTDTQKLQSCFRVLVARHASLRSNFTVVNGQPVQKIHPEPLLDFEQKDARGLSPEQIMKQLSDEADRPFNLEHDRLLRLRLWVRSPEEIFMLMALHHSAIDFTSLLILLTELGRLYAAPPEQMETCLPPPQFQSTDYAQWESEMVTGPEGEGHWRHWQKLGQDSPLLELPTDRPRTARMTFRGAAQVLNLDPILTAKLKQLAAASNTTLYEVMLAAYQVLLHRWSGQKRVLVGAPFSCRVKPEFAQVVGFLANSVVLPADFSSVASFSEFLEQTRRTVRDAEAHQSFPFSLMVERLHPPRIPGRSPIFQTLFGFYDAEGYPMLPLFFGNDSKVDLGGLQLQSLVPEQRAAMFDVSVSMWESSGSITAHFQFNTDLFGAGTMSWALASYKRVLEQVAADPSLRIGQLQLVTKSSPASVSESRPVSSGRPQLPANQERGMAFSLFYFASAGDDVSHDKYRLLLEGAKFADEAGFAGVWTPERHFHPFGGLYPNSAVTSAAVAAITKHVRIRAGSVVLPLHHPVRVAEEWAIVDNLSNGRVEISVASGWNINDFLLAPQNYVGRKSQLAERIETVRKLWRGETQKFSGVDGQETAVNILPRPVQAELPVWLSAFGSIDTFKLAGSIGAGILTHLVGQNVDDLANKIAAYRAALRAHGFDPNAGTVAVMLHTFLGEDSELVNTVVRTPFLDYLRSSMDLGKNVASSMGVALEPDKITEAGINSLVGVAFERYSRSRALFGTVQSCQPLLDKLEAAGVNEIACLVDFGVNEDLVLTSLKYLKQLKDERQKSHAAITAAMPPDFKTQSHSTGDGLGRAAMRRQNLEQRGQLLRTRPTVAKERSES
jgi:natural product biosynthesis luciferase-like monooxygenase protein